MAPLAPYLGAEDAGGFDPAYARARAAALFSGLEDSEAGKADVAGVSDVVASYTVGDGPAAIAFVASISRASFARSSEALLAIARRFGRSSPYGTVYLFLIDEDARAAPPSEGEPLIREARLGPALADLGVDAVLVLDLGSVPAGLRLRAASWRRQSPLRVVEAARAAAAAVGIELVETPIADFYAAAGLSTGSEALGPWLDSGLPAVAIQAKGPSGDAEASPAADIADFAVAFAEAALGEYSIGSKGAYLSGEDVSYLRYPLPFGLLTVRDSTIVLVALMATALLSASLALGLFKGRRRVASLLTVTREALSAFGLSLTALLGSKALAALAEAVVEAARGPSDPSGGDGSPLIVSLALVIRIVSALCVFYAASGIAAKLGLHGDHGRIDAARAALALLCLDALVSVALFPPAAAFLLVAMALVVFASASAITAAIGLLATLLVALPFFDPRVVALIGDATGGSGSVAASILDAGLRGSVVVAAYAAPFGLWLVASSSPEASLRRGRKTAAFWTLGALACAAAEAIVRTAPLGL